MKIDESEIQLVFIRSSGPGGQNVNKVSSSVQLRFDVRNSSSLDLDIKERLINLAGNRMTEDGILIIEARRFRSQERNRADALQRLDNLVQKALQKPKTRKATHPSPASQAERLVGKKRKGQIKQIRQAKPEDW